VVTAATRKTWLHLRRAQCGCWESSAGRDPATALLLETLLIDGGKNGAGSSRCNCIAQGVAVSGPDSGGRFNTYILQLH
jgi:hypothetical protein